MTVTVPAGFHALPLPIVQLSLAAVLKCGQSFRWSIFPLPSTVPPHPTHEYRFCLRDRVVCLRQSDDTLFYRSVFPTSTPESETETLMEAETLAWIKDYFQLDVDLMELYADWSLRDPVFCKLRSRFAGIRMLRQDPWENLISFICSSNNNISRITKMVTSLCTHYSPSLLSLPPPTTPTRLPSPPAESDTDPETNVDSTLHTYHPFPPPSFLAQADVAQTLRSLGFGYRAEFIQKTAKMLVDAHGRSVKDGKEASEIWLDSLRDLSTAQAREELLKFMGVGRKVADCILLMSLDKMEVIPVDTHVHQIAVKHYGLSSSSKSKTAMTPKLYDEVNAKLTRVWGDYAGWAHSVLFTADLKSFSSYGLPPPTPAETPAAEEKPDVLARTVTPAPSLVKRKRSSPSKRKLEPEAAIASSIPDIAAPQLITAEDGVMSLAERVKRRRRATRDDSGRR